ncbi:BLUF domain-containing protein [Azospirillum sp. B21]|uniref:BLUF domain-containing protein n=1 Tax=Azospirillum sp. B21 TaxID=2607496 RepID=UPI0011EC5A58|nr:BLUF domain-containing protein [Azospirillum sp. B21]KAA0581858.1 BLUF domain-containing protein [Azospirillum sp. B21]
MLQVVFRSQLTTLLSYLDIQRLCLAAARNNRKASITGFMVECGGVFLQSLEGQVCDVSETLDRIYRDSRHDHIEIVYSEQDVPRRRFGVWAMNVMFLDDDIFWTKVFGSGYSCDEMLSQPMEPAFAIGVLAMAYRHACSVVGMDPAATGNRLGRIPRIRHMIRR